MPIRFDGPTARFDGACGAEEAMPLVEWLETTPQPRIDLGPCTGLHTALLQALMAAGAGVTVPPEDEFLRRWVLPSLGANAAG